MKLSVTDELTDLYNRCYLNQVCGFEIGRAKRYDRSLGFIMVDIDFFKKINDRYGHNAGDIVIQKVADLLRTNSRNTDIVGRYGGEEFLIIVPEIKREHVMKAAEKFRRSVENEVFSISGDTDIHVTISMGVGVYSSQDETVSDYETCIQSADRALYKAKEAGRNRVEISGEMEEPVS